MVKQPSGAIDQVVWVKSDQLLDEIYGEGLGKAEAVGGQAWRVRVTLGTPGARILMQSDGALRQDEIVKLIRWANRVAELGADQAGWINLDRINEKGEIVPEGSGPDQLAGDGQKNSTGCHGSA